MLYDGAIRFLKVAEGAVQEKKIEMDHQHGAQYRRQIDVADLFLHIHPGPIDC